MRDRYLAVVVSFVLIAGASSQQSSPLPSGSASPAKHSNSMPQAKQAEKATVGTTAAKAADSAQPGVKAAEYSQESFVIEQMHSYYRFEADGTGRKEAKARIRVQSEAGVQQWGQLQEGYNSAVRHHEGRGAWVLTCYGICGLALFGVLAYFFSDFVAH